MSRLFEALSDVAMYQPPPADVPRVVASRDVIELGVHTDDVAPLLSAEQSETEHLSAEAAPVDVSVSEEESTSDVFAVSSTEELETEYRSAENLPAEVAPFDLATLLTAEQPETEPFLREAAPVDAERERQLREAVPVERFGSLEEPPGDVIPPVSAEEPETEQHSAEVGPAEVTLSDLTLSLIVEQATTEEPLPEAAPLDAKTEQHSPEAVSVNVSPSEEASGRSVIAPLSAEELQTEPHSAEGVPIRVHVLYATSPSIVEQEETAQLVPAAALADMFASEDEAASDPDPSLPPQEAETERAPETAPVDAFASEVTPPLSVDQTEVEQLTPAAAPADGSSSKEESASDVTPPLPVERAEAEQVEQEQILPQAVPQGTSPFHMVSSFSTQEAVTKNSKPKSVVSEPAPPVTVRVPPQARLVALTDPNSLGAEKFRALVTRLEHIHKQRELKCFQVTSSVIHEGKTLVSGNVAVTFAKYSGSSTLLIEGDLHRPTLATLFGLNNIRGLSHWWSRPDQDLAQFVYRLGDLPLWFLPAGRPYDRPSDILRSARFARAFSQLTSRFEWIVVDSTPMLPIVDVNLWSRLVDGTLLVIREGVTPAKALKQGLLALDHPKIIGVVLNDASATNETKYDGQYYGSTKPKH